jgi:hypothetical protein
MPEGDICLGVDMYVIPCKIWDDKLSQDIPDMHVGTGFIDWWMTLACQKFGIYTGIKNGVIVHPSHERTASSSGSNGNILWKHNEKSLKEWADRNKVSIPSS